MARQDQDRRTFIAQNVVVARDDHGRRQVVQPPQQRTHVGGVHEPLVQMRHELAVDVLLVVHGRRVVRLERRELVGQTVVRHPMGHARQQLLVDVPIDDDRLDVGVGGVGADVQQIRSRDGARVEEGRAVVLGVVALVGRQAQVVELQQRVEQRLGLR